MASEIFTYPAKTILGKCIDWVWTTLIKRGRLRFYDHELSYSYSFYDEIENHVRSGGKIQIYEVNCTVTIRNESQEPKIIRNVRMVAIVGGVRFPLNVFDGQVWKPTYSFAAGETHRASWIGFRKAFGKAPGHMGLIPIDPPNASIVFEIDFEDEKNRTIQQCVEISEGRRLDPRHIVEK